MLSVRTPVLTHLSLSIFPFVLDRCLNCGVQRYVLFFVLQCFFERNFKKLFSPKHSGLTIKHLKGFVFSIFFVETLYFRHLCNVWYLVEGLI